MNTDIQIIRKYFPDDRIIFMDTEYNCPRNFDMGLLCLCAEEWLPDSDTPNKMSFWVQGNSTGRVSCINWLNERKGALVVAHSIVAEFESMIALGLNPVKQFFGACTYLEAVQLQNSWEQYQYGRYFDELGMVRTSTPPRRQLSKHMGKDQIAEAKLENEVERVETGADSLQEWTPNLLNCLLNFTKLGTSEIVAHSSMKDDTRKLILSKNEFDHKEQTQILEYCMLDVKPLKTLFAGELQRLAHCLGTRHALNIGTYVTNRGRYSAHVAKMQRKGIPIHPERYRHLCKNSAGAIQQIKLDWNESEFELYRDDTKADKSQFAFKKLVKDQKKFDAWVESMPELARTWPKTESGYSGDSKILQKISVSESDPVGRYLRHSKEKKVLEFYKPENLDPKFLHSERLANLDRTVSKNYVGFYVGDDFRMRPHLNPYGTLTGRNGHKAVGFIPAQGKIMRALVDPPEGYCILEHDYASQEDLIPASPKLSGDTEILKAYLAGDPYLAFAALTGKCEMEDVSWWVRYRHDQSELSTEDKAKHKQLSKYRKDAKPQKLGVGFGMKFRALARHMGATEADATTVLSKYWSRVRKYGDFRAKVQDCYVELKTPLVLADGWALGPDNKNMLSVLNFPVQGYGQVILRHELDLAEALPEAETTELLCTVHDALWNLVKIEDADKADARIRATMIQAATEVLKIEGMRVGSERLNPGEYWLHDIEQSKFDRWKPFFEASYEEEEFF